MFSLVNVSAEVVESQKSWDNVCVEVVKMMYVLTGQRIGRSRGVSEELG
jgi:hypothetical protein